LWRLEVQTFRGRTFGNWRKWYRKGEDWKPTKEGFTFPLDRLADLTGCLMAYHGLEPRPTWTVAARATSPPNLKLALHAEN
jgi:hypothetical protein